MLDRENPPIPSDPIWWDAIVQRWPWTKEFFLSSKEDTSPADLALETDMRSIKGSESDIYKANYVNKIWNLSSSDWISVVNPYVEYEWMHIFMKLDFEEFI